MLLEEGELAFDFSGCVSASRLDRQGCPMPQGLKLVDFVVEEKERRLLIEVKDPEDSRATASSRLDWAQKLKGGELINGSLVPKARGSYLFLHLMEQDDKPLIFIALLGLGKVPLDPALLGPFQDRLRSRLDFEADLPWRRQYIRDCVVLAVDRWSEQFPAYPLTRKPRPAAQGPGPDGKGMPG